MISTMSGTKLVFFCFLVHLEFVFTGMSSSLQDFVNRPCFVVAKGTNLILNLKNSKTIPVGIQQEIDFVMRLSHKVIIVYDSEINISDQFPPVTTGHVMQLEIIKKNIVSTNQRFIVSAHPNIFFVPLCFLQSRDLFFTEGQLMMFIDRVASLMKDVLRLSVALPDNAFFINKNRNIFNAAGFAVTILAKKVKEAIFCFEIDNSEPKQASFSSYQDFQRNCDEWSTKRSLCIEKAIKEFRFPLSDQDASVEFNALFNEKSCIIT